MSLVTKVYSKRFSHSEIEIIHNYVIDKLQVKDLFKVRDRFEGNQYLINVTKKYFTAKTILEYCNFEKRNEIKIGFLNSINLEKMLGVKINLLENKLDMNDILDTKNQVFVFINIESKICELYGVIIETNYLINNIQNYLNQFKSIIYNK